MSFGKRTWWQKVRESPAADAEGWEECSGLDKTEAEQLLDWLEASGCRHRQVALNDDGFAVRWRR